MASRGTSTKAKAWLTAMTVVLLSVSGLQAWAVVPHLDEMHGAFVQGMREENGRTAPDEPKAAPAVDAATADAGRALDARAKALLAGDPADWIGSVSPRASGKFRAEQLELFERLRLLPLTAWRYEIRPGTPAPAGATGFPDGRRLAVRLVYRLDGQDRDVWRNQTLTFVDDAGAWRMAEDLTPTTDRDLWDLTEIAVGKGKRSIVIGARSERKRLKAYVQETDRASGRMDELFGKAWPRKTVVLAPGTTKQVQQLTDLGAEEVGAFWALTFDTTLDGDGWTTRDQPAGLWVLINPEAAHDGDSYERRIVLRHEMVHVATGYLERNDPPLWTEEGYAEYVAYEDEGLTRREMTPEARDAVEDGSWSKELPTDEDYRQTDAEPLAATYEFGWLVYDFIEREYGEDAAHEFHREVTRMTPEKSVRPVGDSLLSDSKAVEAAVRKLFDLDLATFVADWRDAIEKL